MDICTAIKNHEYDLIKQYIMLGRDINERDHFGMTPLMWIANTSYYKNAEIAQLLIDAGADVNLTCTDGVTPLIMASKRGAYDTVKILLRAGADINVQDKYGRNAMYYALCISDIKCKNLITSELVMAGLSPVVKDKFGISPFDKLVNAQKAALMQMYSEYSLSQQTDQYR